MTTTDWLVPGVQVAEYNSHYYDASVILTTIEKLTPTQVVLANGHRYHRNKTSYGGGLRSVGAGQSELLPITDKGVRDAIARTSLRRLNSHIDGLTRDAINGRAGIDSILVTLDQIAASVAEAQGKLVDLGPEAKLDAEATS